MKTENTININISSVTLENIKGYQVSKHFGLYKLNDVPLQDHMEVWSDIQVYDLTRKFNGIFLDDEMNIWADKTVLKALIKVYNSEKSLVK